MKKVCLNCKKEFEAKRESRKYCSNGCKTIIPNAETLFYNDNDNNVYLFDGDTVEIAEDEMVINS